MLDGTSRDPEGQKYGFKGVFHDVQARERIAQTFEFEGMPGHVLLETVTFTEADGKTRFLSTSVFQSVEDRDGMVRSGMRAGAEEILDRLAELLRER